MAKTSFVRTLALTTDEVIIETPCKQCQQNSKKSEGVKICLNCDENLCLECVTRHTKATKTRNHKITDRGKTLPRGLHLPNVSFEDKCMDHQENFIDSYCKDHDKTGCFVCMSSAHKKCDKVIYVTSSSYYVDKEKQLSEVKEDISHVKKQLELLRAARMEDKQQLGKDRDDIFQNLQDLRKKFNKMYDDLERRTKAELQELYENFAVKAKNDILACSTLIESLDSYVPKLNTSLRTEREAFSYVKNARASVINGWYAINYVKRTTSDQQLHFTLDETIEKLLNNVKKLGYFGNVSDVFTVNFDNEYDVSMEKELVKKELVYFGTTFIHDGTILLTDFKNKKVKHVDQSSNSLTGCEVPGRPFAVCQVNQSTCAVTLPNEKLIQLISLGKQMELMSSFDTEAKCRGISHYNDELFTSCGGGFNESQGHIRVFSTAGEPLRLIDPEIKGKRFLSSPVHLAISPGGKMIYVADRDRGVLVLSTEGKVLHTFCKTPLKTPQCIALDDEGGYIACDHGTNNVVYVGPDQKKCGILLKSGEDIKTPLSVSYDSFTRTLAVTARNSKFVKLYLLKPLI